MAQLFPLSDFELQLEKSRAAIRRRTPEGLFQIKMRLKIEQHDYEVKHRKAIELLEAGLSVKLEILLGGRDTQFKEQTIELANRFVRDLENVATADKEPSLVGRSIIIVVSPISPER